MVEKDIIHENGAYWVGKFIGCYGVYKNVNTHAISDSSYAKTADGLSIAIARCNYLAGRDS